ncbi:MAG: hypothetical protein KAH57_06550 [Thermoplasmata archaeon]|nr:hypothetical protein [Thermoplasmata archaeon]
MQTRRKTFQIAIIFLLIMTSMAALVYNLPYGSSASNYDVSLTADNASKEVAQGRSIVYLLTIKNEGNNADRFDINLTVSKDPSTWQVTLSQTTTSSMASGATSQFTVNVRAPSSNITISSYCLATIRVDSRVDPSNSTSSVLLTTNIERKYDVEIESPKPQYVDPGSSATYTFNVTNTGNDLDGYTLTAVDKPTGWTAAISFSSSNYASGSAKLATMTVNTDSKAQTGAYTVTVQAKSRNDPATTANQTITVNVNQKHRVTISTDTGGSSKSVDITSNSYVTYTVEVANRGNGEDEFLLELYIPSQFKSKGWSGTIQTANSGPMDADERKNVSVTIYPPKKSDSPQANEVGEFYVNATSDGDGTKISQVMLSCVILPYYNLFIENTGPSTKSCQPDGTVTFNFWVNNTGNDNDEVDLSLQKEDGFAQSSISPSSFSLANGGSRYVTISINPEEDVVKARAYSFTLWANSTNDVSKSYTFFVTIDKNYGAYLDAPSGAIVASAQPGLSYTFPVRVQNKGNGRDTFDLSVTGETTKVTTEWSPLISSAVTSQLTSDGWFLFNITMTAPSNATMGTYKFLATGTSWGDITVSKQLELSVRIPQLYNVDMSANKESVKGEYSLSSSDPNVVNFTLNIYNRGSGEDDSIRIRVKSAPADFSGLYSVFFVDDDRSLTTLAVDGVEDAKLQIEMPTRSSGILAGTYEFIVEITSDNGTLQTSDDKSAEIVLNLVLQPLHDVDLLSSANNTKVKIGNSVTFSTFILNKGTVADYYLLSIEYPNVDYVDFSISTLKTQTLQSLSEEQVNVTINVRNGADPNLGEVWVKVVATHPSDSTITSSIYFTAVFEDEYSGTLDTNDNFEQAHPGNSAWFNITLRNTGTRTTDTFSIAVEEGKGDDVFDNIEISPASLILKPDQVATISINITVPSIDDEIINSGIYEVVFKATSDGETTQTFDDITVDNQTLKVKVMPVYKVQLLIPEGSKTVDPGTTHAGIALNITNKGNDPSTINVKVDTQTASGNRKWATISPSTVADLPANGAKDVSLKLVIPTNAAAGLVTFYFRAEVAGHIEVFELTTFEVVVEEDYDVNLYLAAADSISKEAEPNELVEFKVLMKNKGNAIDSFELSMNADKPVWIGEEFGFLIDDAKTKSVVQTDVAIDAIYHIWMDIQVPENAPDGLQDFTLTAKSIGDSSVKDQITLTVDVAPNRDVELLTSEATKDVIPDVDQTETEVEYVIQVVNLGEDLDPFKLEVVSESTLRPAHIDAVDWASTPKSDYPTWVKLEKSKTSSIPKGGQAEITVTVRIPDNYYDPAVFNTVIWAYSEGEEGLLDDKYSEVLVLKTEIKQTYGANIIVPLDRRPTEDDLLDTENILYQDFVVRVKNTGTGVDTFKIEIDDDALPSSSSLERSDNYATSINPEEYGEISIRVEFEPETAVDKYRFSVRWISEGEGDGWDEDNDYTTTWKEITIEVKQTFGVSVEVDKEQQEGEVGEKVDYIFTVKNLGNDDDNFRVEIYEPDYKRWVSADKSSFTLGPKGSATQEILIKISVRIPDDVEEALAGLYDYSITFRRDVSNIVEQEKAIKTINITLEIENFYKHEITTDDDIQNAEVGDIVSYSFKVTNKGNGVDTYNLKVLGDKKMWGSLSATTITLDPDEWVLVSLDVIVPLLGMPENYDGETPYVTDGEDVKKDNYLFTIEVESSKDRNGDPVEVTFTTSVEQTFVANVPEMDEATEDNRKSWDVNDKSMVIKFYVENLGNKDDTFKIKPPTVLPIGWRLLISPTIVTVGMGDQKEITVTISALEVDNFAVGKQQLRFQVLPDSGSLTGKKAKVEFNMYFNVSAPELVMKDDSIKVSGNLVTGEKTTVEVTIYNEGTETAEDVTVSLYDEDGTFIGDDVQTINYGSSEKFEIDWIPTSGKHTLRAIVNKDMEDVIETNEDNNEAKADANLPTFDWQEKLGGFWGIFIVAIILLVLLLLVIVFAFNKNREAKLLTQKLRSADLGGGRAGGPRKLMKEAGGAPVPPKPAGGGLPSAPGAVAAPGLAPAKGEKKGGAAPKGNLTVKVKCPECTTEQIHQIEKKPAEVTCNHCGVIMRIGG